MAGEFWRRKLRRQILPSRLTFPSASRVRGLLDGYLCISLFLSPVKAVLRGGASPWHSAPRRACHHVSALEAHSHTALRHDDVADGRVDAGWNTNTLTQAYRKCIMRRAALPCKQGAMELQPRSRPCSREYAPQLRALAARIAGETRAIAWQSEDPSSIPDIITIPPPSSTYTIDNILSLVLLTYRIGSERKLGPS